MRSIRAVGTAKRWATVLLVAAGLASGAAKATLILEPNGVVLDTATMLEWEQNPNHGQVNWADAGIYVSGLALDGGGWRLPSLSELHQLYSAISAATGCVDCTGDQGVFSGIQLGYWSTAQYFAGQPGAYYVGFWKDNYQAGLFQTSNAWAWAVRAGDVDVNVPEPSILLLIGVGLFGLGFSRRKKSLVTAALT